MYPIKYLIERFLLFSIEPMVRAGNAGLIRIRLVGSVNDNRRQTLRELLCGTEEGAWTPQSVKLKPGETVFFSWIVYKSRTHRDRVNAKVMKDPRLAKMMDPKKRPFDGKRMFWGGFKAMVEL